MAIKYARIAIVKIRIFAKYMRPIVWRRSKQAKTIARNVFATAKTLTIKSWRKARPYCHRFDHWLEARARRFMRREKVDFAVLLVKEYVKTFVDLLKKTA
jgi:hypothetical protein